MNLFLKAKIQRANEEAPIMAVAERYGMIRKEARDGAQISCPFHGVDSNPSAHVYETSNKFWCFACHKLMSVVGFVAKKEEVSLSRAVSYLEQWFDLPPLDAKVEMLKPVVLRKSISGPRAMLKAVWNLLKEEVGSFTLDQYDRAFTAYWALQAQKAPQESLCGNLLDQLLIIKGDRLLGGNSAR